MGVVFPGGFVADRVGEAEAIADCVVREAGFRADQASPAVGIGLFDQVQTVGTPGADAPRLARRRDSRLTHRKTTAGFESHPAAYAAGYRLPSLRDSSRHYARKNPTRIPSEVVAEVGE